MSNLFFSYFSKASKHPPSLQILWTNPRSQPSASQSRPNVHGVNPKTTHFSKSSTKHKHQRERLKTTKPYSSNNDKQTLYDVILLVYSTCHIFTQSIWRLWQVLPEPGFAFDAWKATWPVGWLRASRENGGFMRLQVAAILVLEGFGHDFQKSSWSEFKWFVLFQREPSTPNTIDHRYLMILGSDGQAHWVDQHRHKLQEASRLRDAIWPIPWHEPFSCRWMLSKTKVLKVLTRWPLNGMKTKPSCARERCLKNKSNLTTNTY